ncbi:hypothetical protein RND81_08G089600 [Saponaria officinalis]|uniref:Uncharacterized protein n=1 Tax=Saponaria officinalis TaxID=3572 RepID=A0AAW1J5C4_SAPOF
MAKNRKQVCSSPTNAASSDDSDAEKSNRQDERGRTVLAKVGNAIQNITKIRLEWHPIRKTPCGENRFTFTFYIGVVVRERVCITYASWKDVPKVLLDYLYEVITKGFTVIQDRKKWILSRADDRWRAFKTRLRNRWLYKKSRRLRKRPPWKYPWITQTVWDKFKEMCTAENFQNELKAQFERGEIVLAGGHDDILARILKKTEHSGRVRGVGSGITNTEYFGNEERSIVSGNIYDVTLKPRANEAIYDRCKPTRMFGCQGGDKLSLFGGHNDGQFREMSEKSANTGGDINDRIGVGQREGLFTKLLTKGQDDFYELRPDLHFQQPDPSPSSVSSRDMDFESQPITEHTLAKV